MYTKQEDRQVLFVNATGRGTLNPFKVSQSVISNGPPDSNAIFHPSIKI